MKTLRINPAIGIPPSPYSRARITPFERRTITAQIEAPQTIVLRLDRPNNSSLVLDELTYDLPDASDRADAKEKPFWWLNHSFSLPQTVGQVRGTFSSVGLNTTPVDDLVSAESRVPSDEPAAKTTMTVGVVQQPSGRRGIMLFTRSAKGVRTIEKLEAAEELVEGRRAECFRWPPISHGRWWWGNKRYGGGLPINENSLRTVELTFKELGLTPTIVSVAFEDILAEAE